MSAFVFTAVRGLSLLGDEVGAWMADTTVETITGAELITNGDFASDTIWSKGTGWTIAAGVASCDGSQTGDSDLKQDVSAAVSTTYIIQYTISNYSAGEIQPNFLGAGGLGIARSVNGTFTDTIVSPSDATGFFALRADVDFIGDIDDVSVRLAVPDLSTNDNGLGVFGSIDKTAVATGADLVGYAVSSTDYAENPDTSLFRLGASGVVTEAAWVNNGTATVNVKISGAGSTANNGYALYVINGAPAAVDVNSNNNPTASNTIDDDEWHFLVAIFDNSTNARKIYVDGALVGTSSGSTTNNTTDEYQVGGNGSIKITLSRNFDYELTAAQIKQIYDKEKHLFKKHSYYTQEGISYSLDIAQLTPAPTANTKKNDTTTLSGVKRSVVHHNSDDWAISTTLIHRTDNTTYIRKSEFMELMFSTRGSETFTYDPYGSVASPDDPLTVQRVGQFGFTPEAFTEYFRGSFNVSEVDG